MTDQNSNNDASVAPEATAEAGPDMVPAEQVKAALEAAGEFKDKLLRALAEMDNLRKRTERDVADARLYGVTGFARDVLQVADNMHRALEAIGPELRADPNLNTFIEGIELTERELMKVLEKHGVKKFSPQGEKFDPNFHQAMFEVADGSAAPGMVAQVIQAGYLLGERVLRPAMVAVGKAAKPATANDNPDPSK